MAHQRGVSLIEVLTAASLFFICIGMILFIYVSSSNALTKGRERLKMQKTASLALSIMSSELREATKIYTPGLTGEGREVNELEFAKINPFSLSLGTMKYYLSGNKLFLKNVDSERTYLIAENIQSLRFKYLKYKDASDKTLLEISLTLYDPQGKRTNFLATTEIYMKSKTKK